MYHLPKEQQVAHDRRKATVQRMVRAGALVKEIAHEIRHNGGYTSTLINRLGYSKMLVHHTEKSAIMEMRKKS